ncbi:MAG: hypothetical protein ABIR79_10425 [Candidatus Binatia bacterium]
MIRLLVIVLTICLGLPAAAVAAVVPDFGKALSYKVAPDGATIVVEVERDSDGGRDLYSVPIAGGTPVLLAHDTVDSAITANQHFLITADGTRVVFTAKPGSVMELWGVPIGGPADAAVKLSPDGESALGGFHVTPDSQRVVYRKFPGALPIELFSVPILGGPSQKLNNTLPPGGNVFVGLAISPDSSRVAFIATDGTLALFTAPVDGSAPAVKVSKAFPSGGGIEPLDDFSPVFAFSPDSSRLVYRADQDTNDVLELYSVPAAGGVLPTKLNGVLPAFGDVLGSRFTPDGSKVVFTVFVAPAMVSLHQREIFVVPTLGGTATRLNPPPPSSDYYQVLASQITPDGAHVVFTIQAGFGGASTMYCVPIAGGASTILNDPGPPTVSFVFWLPDSTHALLQHVLPGKQQLYVAPICGGGPAVELSGTLEPNTIVSAAVTFTPSHAFYFADQVDDRSGFDLFSVPVAGGTAATRINPPAPAGGAIGGSPTIAGDRIVYLVFFPGGVTEIWSLRLTGGTATQLVGASTPGPTPLPTQTPGPSPTNIVGIEPCDNCRDDDGDTLVDRADPDCSARADGGGVGVGDPARAKAASKCQKAVTKAGAGFVAKKQKLLQGCVAGVQHCLQVKPQDAGCITKAAAKCGAATAKIGPLETKLVAAVQKACGDPPLAGSDLLQDVGLAFDGEEATCAADYQVPALATVADVALCLARRLACQTEHLIARQVPRARELLGIAGIDAGELGCVDAGADGSGQGISDPTRGKALGKCDKGVQKAGAAFAKSRLAGLTKCIDAVAACVQLKPADPSCVPKAQAQCAKIGTRLAGPAGPAAKARAAIAKACSAPADMLIATGLGHATSAVYCAAVDVPALTTPADVAECIVRDHACRVTKVIEATVPRGIELLGRGGLAP